MAIQGNTSLLLHDIDSAHPHYNGLKNIEKSVKNGASFTNQLLRYTRNVEYEVEPINLNQLVKEIADVISRTREETIIHSELSEDSFTIKADQVQIEHVPWNLYNNPADSMTSGGKITVRTSNITSEEVRGRLYDQKPDNYVKLTVTDTGKGMDKKTQEHIFKPFYTTKEIDSGTGLGLASVFGIVQCHGGYIEVESEKGHGTTFTVLFPAYIKLN